MHSTKTFLQWGEGDHTLVFLHYFGGSAQSWQYVSEKLSDNFRCVALHLPGFGNTPPLEEPTIIGFSQWIHKQLVMMDIFDCTLIGHSMSGKLALHLAANQSEINIEHLILVAPSPPTHEPMPSEEKERMLKHPDRQEAAQTVKNAIVKSLNAEQTELAIDTQLIIDEATWRWWLLEGMNHSIAELMPQIEVPVTLLISEDDPVITIETVQQEIIPLLPKAHVVSTRDVGHLIPLEAPEWIADQLRKIIA